MKAYSYLRWSSEEQTKGDSLERQLEATRTICSENGWNLDESLMRDEGVSAYKGDNISKGSLAGFITEIEAKRISTPCVLVVEALDRLTRTQIKDARNLFEKLLENKVQICTAYNGKVYTEEALNSPLDIMMFLMEMNAAHEYSRNIGRRSRAAWTRKKERARKGVVLTRKLPAWIAIPKGSTSIKDFKKIPERVKIVKRIFKEYLKGIGTATIAVNLTKEKVKPLGSAKVWNVSSIFRLLKSISVIGKYQPKYHVDKKTRTDEGAVIEGYYPAIINDDVFYRTQEQLRTNFAPRGPRKNCYNLFSGLLFCAKCDGSMVLKTGAISKKRKTPYITIVCSLASRGGKCKYATVQYRPLELTLLQVLGTMIVAKTDRSDNSAEARLLTLNGRLVEIQKQLDNANVSFFSSTPMVSGPVPQTIVDKMNELEKERKSLEEEKECFSKTDFDERRLKSLIQNWKPMEPTRENRLKMQVLLRSFIQRIVINPKSEQAEIILRIQKDGVKNVIRWKKKDPTFTEINGDRLSRHPSVSPIWLEST